MELPGLPPKQGLYDPRHEKDSCGIGFVVNIKGQKSHDYRPQGLQVLKIWPTAARKVAIPVPAMAPEFCFKSLMTFLRRAAGMPA